MSNADMFTKTFGIYATELWAMSEQDFLEWLNSKYSEEKPCKTCQEFDCYGCEWAERKEE